MVEILGDVGNNCVTEDPENEGGGGTQNSDTEMILAKRRDTSFLCDSILIMFFKKISPQTLPKAVLHYCG